MTAETTECAISVLQDLLRVYDHRFLELDERRRERLIEGTRRALGEEEFGDAARAALPSSYRLRLFCLRYGLRDELERLIRDEAEGRPPGAVVVGGRVYAMYPYLRGVPRDDVDITSEVGVAHRLDAAGWHGPRLRVRGRAVLEQIETRETRVEIVLRNAATLTEHRVVAGVTPDGSFDAEQPVQEPGIWEVHVIASTLGVSREAPLGPVRGPRVKTDPQRRAIAPDTEATIHFTTGDRLAVLVERDEAPIRPLTRLRRRLLPRHSARLGSRPHPGTDTPKPPTPPETSPN
ncbi:hypothetical protein [Actinomadura sp. SCN-SB]|uniref:hypothetical protein n=1 Tax=Actinomadura sp. SCN-SB TaxID=3373092 RepID=UPI0037508C69